MNDRAHTDDILERFSQKVKKPEIAQDVANENAYRAFGPQAAQTRESKLQLRYQDGSVGLLSYAYLTEVICTSHQFLSLIYTHCVITLEGRHLDMLLELFQDDKIRWIACFNASKFDSVAENKPIVSKITRQRVQDFMTSGS